MKTNTCICLDVELLVEAKKRKINLSFLINEFLRSYFKVKATKTEDKDITINIAEAEAKLLELKNRKEKIEAKLKKERAGRPSFSGD